jgi:hypothetical protein
VSRARYTAPARRSAGAGATVVGLPRLEHVAYTPDPPKPKKPPTAAAQRHMAMVEDRLAGMSWPDVGRKHGVAHPEAALRNSHWVLTQLPLAQYRKLGR